MARLSSANLVDPTHCAHCTHARAERRRSIGVCTAGCLAVLALAVLLRPQPGLAQAAPGGPAAQTETVLPTVEVIAPTPLLGSGGDRDKVPAETRVLTDKDI